MKLEDGEVAHLFSLFHQTKNLTYHLKNKPSLRRSSDSSLPFLRRGGFQWNWKTGRLLVYFHYFIKKNLLTTSKTNHHCEGGTTAAISPSMRTYLFKKPYLPLQNKPSLRGRYDRGNLFINSHLLFKKRLCEKVPLASGTNVAISPYLSLSIQTKTQQLFW